MQDIATTVPVSASTATPRRDPCLKKHIFVCMGTNCSAKGSADLLLELRRTIRERGERELYKITRSNCMGRCDQGPTVTVCAAGDWFLDEPVSTILKAIDQPE
jgi:sirohydrochlorin cobaltochelatase